MKDLPEVEIVEGEVLDGNGEGETPSPTPSDLGIEVPEDRAALEALPGVGRKTANVVLNCWFRQETFAVDTHILRVGNRTGLAKGKTFDPSVLDEVAGFLRELGAEVLEAADGERALETIRRHGPDVPRGRPQGPPERQPRPDADHQG